MRKIPLFLIVIGILAAGIGCRPQQTDAEKNAPPPPGPHGGPAQPAGAAGGPHGDTSK